MNSRDYRKIGGLMLLILFLSACLSPSAGAPAPTPVPEVNVRKTLEAMIVKTAAAAQTQTMTARPPTLTPTATRKPTITPTQPTPSPTFFFSLFTATSDIKVESTDVSLNATAQYINSIGGVDVGGGNIKIIKRMWACYVRYSPNVKVKPGEKFYAGWEVVNIGSEPWTANTIDFLYRGGYNGQGTKRRDLSSTVGSGSMLPIGATFIAPRRTGSYRSYWVLQVGHNSFCPMWMNFEVGK